MATSERKLTQILNDVLFVAWDAENSMATIRLINSMVDVTPRLARVQNLTMRHAM